jgi:hypothetical protein
MKPADLPERYQVAAAWGLLLLLAAVLIAGLVVPLAQAYRDGADRLEQGYARLLKLESIARERPEAIRQREAAVDELLDRFAFPGDMDADQVLLELRKRMEALAARHEVELQSVDSMRPRRGEGGLESVGLTVSARSGLAGTVDLLRSLQESSPLLLVDDLSVQAVSKRRSRRSRAAAEPGTHQLGLKFSVEAFLREGRG